MQFLNFPHANTLCKYLYKSIKAFSAFKKQLVLLEQRYKRGKKQNKTILNVMETLVILQMKYRH